jgi:hypothetical protein
MTYLYQKLIDASDSSFTGKMIEESSATNKEISKKFAAIVSGHLSLRNNQNGIRSEIKNYLTANGNAQAYIKVPLDLVIK